MGLQGSGRGCAGDLAMPDAPRVEGLLDVREVAAFLKVSEKTVRRLVAHRQLRCVRIGRKVLFDPADVLRFVAARKE